MYVLDRWPIVLSRVLLGRGVGISAEDLQIQRRLVAALDWILVARKQTADDGISAHFDVLRNRWAASYPETTGYTIPTLLACAKWLDRQDLVGVAVSMADFLLQARTPEGGVGHWRIADRVPQKPVVFDTGQVIRGWLSIWHETGNHVYLDAATEAADWLVEVQSESGAWIRYQHLEIPKVIDTRVALTLIELSQVTSRSSYTETAIRNLDWAISQQRANGWFHRAAFRDNEDPYTHTIAYTAEGLFKSGLLLDEARYVTSAERVVQALLEQQRLDGALASTFGLEWNPTSRSSCLTGNCQIAILWLRFYALSGNDVYLQAARRAIAYVASTQDLATSNLDIRGGIAGSYPIWGKYARFEYPNWAAKFFIDALLALENTLAS